MIKYCEKVYERNIKNVFYDSPFYCVYISLLIRTSYRSYIIIIKKLCGMIAESEPLNSFIIVIYNLWPTYSFLLLFHDCAFGNGRIDHFMDLLNDLLNRYYKY